MGTQISKAVAPLVRKYPPAAARQIQPPPPPHTGASPAKPLADEEQAPNVNLNHLLNELSSEVSVDRFPELPKPKHMPQDKSVRTGKKGIEDQILAPGKISVTGIARSFAELREGRNVFDDYGISKDDQVKLYRHISVPVRVTVDEFRTDCYFEPYPDWIQIGEFKGTLGLEYIQATSHSALLKKKQQEQEKARQDAESKQAEKQ